jgi:hypothetical protein
LGEEYLLGVSGLKMVWPYTKQGLLLQNSSAANKVVTILLLQEDLLGEEVPYVGLGVALAEVVHIAQGQEVLGEVLSEVLEEGIQVVADTESERLII